MAIVWDAQDTLSGSTVRLSLNPDGAVVIAPPEGGDRLLSAAAVVLPSGLLISLGGVNVPRGVNETVLYTENGAYRSVNKWGVDVLVNRATMAVIGVRDRERTSFPPFNINSDHFVLSGHFNAGRVLLSALTPGSVVSVLDVAPEPLPSSTSASHCSVWLMLWPNSPRVDVAGLPSFVDEIRLAFFVENGRMVGYGPYGGREKLAVLLNGFISARSGRFVSASVGGGGLNISIGDPDSYVGNVVGEMDRLGVPLGGLNWDWEHRDFRANASKCISVSRKMKAKFGEDFYVSWSPNGTYKDDYRNALRDSVDVVDEIAQQMYDDESGISYEEALHEVKIYCELFGKERTGVGMMLGSNPKRWTLQQCSEYMKRFCTDEGIVISNLWEGSHPQVGQWAEAMGKAVG